MNCLVILLSVSVAIAMFAVPSDGIICFDSAQFKIWDVVLFYRNIVTLVGMKGLRIHDKNIHLQDVHP